jgi:pimeloyl-ACP methyl ester carboxylesterase
MYGEICREPPPPTVLAGLPALLVHAEQFGLVRDEQLEEYAEALDHIEIVGVPGGHIVYWDAYDQTADAVERFLAAELA